jgi:hypothetical protein
LADAQRRTRRAFDTDRPPAERRRLAARGKSLAAFDGRCILAGCVAPPSNIPDILGRHALPAGRIAGLGATPDFHHGLLAGAVGKAVVFARRDVTIGDTERWLADATVRDVPHPGERIRAGRRRAGADAARVTIAGLMA